MIVFPILVSLSLEPSTGYDCRALGQPTVDVALAIQPVSIGSSARLADLAALAARQQAPLRHPAYGYYVGTFVYAVKPVGENASNVPCPKSVRIRIDMALVRRHIEVATELKKSPCLYARYLQHYEQHATSDAAIIEDYRVRAEQAFEPSPKQATPGALRSKRQVFDAVVRKLDRVLASLDLDRAAAARRIDNTVELENLGQSCHSGSSSTTPRPL